MHTDSSIIVLFLSIKKVILLFNFEHETIQVAFPFKHSVG